MLIIGESLNASRKEVEEAVHAHNEAFIQELAQAQVNAGAQMLDVNAAVPGRYETEDLPWMVRTVQRVVDIPLVLDSADPEALIEAMAVHRGRPMINSVSAEKDKMSKLLPVVAEHDCSVIALCMDDSGIPQGADERLLAGRTVVAALKTAGKQAADIYVDPLVLAAATDPNAPSTTLKVIKGLQQGETSGVHITAGVSNVSFSLPVRSLLNRVFLTMALTMGLDACIVNVRDKAMMSTIYAAMGLRGDDRFRTYLQAYRQGNLVP